MEIREVRIIGFGPLAGETLALAPGMTVVFGPNESAKTSLHAATYAAICGMRRSRGKPRSEDAQFGARHRPWNGGPWKVVARVVLADGREIELSHDLAGGVDCRATDVALGRDVSSAIMFDGAPDGSRWLGFDRTSFLATACVRQAEIAAILNDPDSLQDELQRAAASAGRDETAAQAIQRLRTFSSENVGLDRSNSTKPLRRSIVRAERAEIALAEARERHKEYLSGLDALDEHERERDGAADRLKLAEAVVARTVAQEKSRQFERAVELSASHPQEPAPASAEEELANAVAEALTLWDAAPAEPDLNGPTIVDLEGEIATLPQRPDGDLAPAEAVLAADAALTAATGLLERHEAAEPPPVQVDVTPEELHELADRLAAVPAVDEGGREQVEELRSSLSKPTRASRLPLLVALLLAFGGLVLALSVTVALGLAVAAAAASVAAVLFWTGRREPDAAAREALAAAERMVAEQEAAAQEVSGRREASLTRLSDLGLDLDPQAIRAYATHVAKRGEWQQRHSELVEQLEKLETVLRRELETRTIAVHDNDLHAAVGSYKQMCREREEQNRAALRRSPLEQRLQERRIAEEQAGSRALARTGLVAIADRLGVPETEPMRIATALRAWQEKRLEELEQHEAARTEWNELRLLLDGRSVDDLRVEAAQASRVAAELAEGLDPALFEGSDPGTERTRLRPLRREAEERARAANLAKGQLEEMARGLPSVAEAEEELEAAKGELARVRHLEQTLSHTIDFLEAAQDRIHRTIAPVLCQTLEAWLPRVAVERRGEVLVERYDDVMVDPETLSVKVRLREGPWRDASYGSEGTKEQIYLLLRVALAEHLTTPGEKAPLILDEITAQCDSDRCRALLDLLHELSAERQVILFTHDQGALAWAEDALEPDSGRDRLVTRLPVQVP